MDNAEKAMYSPIAEEAKKRGYNVEFTTNKFKKCEIGFYCQHINYPENARFSIIMLHDIIQQYSNWPDIWYREPWNIYDVGILPSNQWERNWIESSKYYYSRPKNGVYKVGWPKADVIKKTQDQSYKVSFYEKHGLDPSKKTVLYAPAWENDGKEDDFVKSLQQLDVNMLIKQAPWVKEDYPEIYENCEKMAKLHRGLPNVCILPMETNIFEAIAVSDLLVSEESSTMCEAAMMGIPAISVSDWLIPDVKPSRFPKCDYNFVNLTVKNKLAETTSEILNNYSQYQKAVEEFKNENFSNLGRTSTFIMDIIDELLFGNKSGFSPIVPKRLVILNSKDDKERKNLFFRTRVVEKAKHKKLYSIAYSLYKKIFK